MSNRNLVEFVNDFNPTKLESRMIECGFDRQLSRMMCKNYEKMFYNDFRIYAMKLNEREVYQ